MKQSWSKISACVLRSIFIFLRH